MAQRLTEAASRRLAQRLARNADYAAVKATNALLNQAQDQVRIGIRSRFEVRQDRFIMNLVKRGRGDFATKDQPIGRLRIEGPQNEFDGRAARVLTRHEEGGISLPSSGADPVLAGRFALPTDFLRVASRAERARLSLKNVGLVPIREASGQTYYASTRARGASTWNAYLRRQKKGPATPVRTTAKGVVQIKGRRGVFALDPRYHRGVKTLLIYQRLGRDNIQLLYFGAPRVVIPPRLFFLDTARRTIEARRVEVYRNALREALK